VATFSYILLLVQNLVGVVRGTAPQAMGASH
jgi:hypothetical protein